MRRDLVRGQIRPTTRREAIERAESMVGYKPEKPEGAPFDAKRQTIKYRLSKYNGGKDPYADHPADWSYGLRTPTSDCAGFVAWALGYDRKQIGTFPKWGGWINTDSMIAEARQFGDWFEEISEPEVGCLLVTPSIYKGGKRTKVGHVGMVVEVPEVWDGDTRSLTVVHCSSRPKGRSAVKRTNGAFGATRGVLLRYKKAAPEPREDETNTEEGIEAPASLLARFWAWLTQNMRS